MDSLETGKVIAGRYRIKRPFSGEGTAAGEGRAGAQSAFEEGR